MSVESKKKRKRKTTHVNYCPVDEDKHHAQNQAQRHDGVGAAGSVQVLCQGPGGGVGVVALDGGAAPRVVAVAVYQEVAVGLDDGAHDAVVDEAAEDGAVYLGEKHVSGWDFDCVNKSKG